MTANSSDTPAIQVRGLRHTYQGGIDALKGIDLTVDQGEVLGIVGQNGSGKTTLVRHFNGLLQPTSGDVIVFGQNTRDLDASILAKDVGYVFQNPDYQLFLPTVHEELAYGPKNIGMNENEVEEAVEWVISSLELDGWRDMHPFQLTKLERKVLSIACVLAMRPRIIVFDEPTTGQDRPHIQKLMSLVKELTETEHTLIMVTHDMSLVAEHCSRAAVLTGGELLMEGTPQQVFSSKPILAAAGLHPPDITTIAERANLGAGILSTQAAYRKIREGLGLRNSVEAGHTP